jgi:hypothetical protein
MTQKNETKTFVIQCPTPKCFNKDLTTIQYVEMLPSYSNLRITEKGMLAIGNGDSSINYDGAQDEKLWCRQCGEEWDLPENASIEWE